MRGLKGKKYSDRKFIKCKALGKRERKAGSPGPEKEMWAHKVQKGRSILNLASAKHGADTFSRTINVCGTCCCIYDSCVYFTFVEFFLESAFRVYIH